MSELVVASLASFAAGFVNSIAGGGGLVSIPILFGLFPTAPAATLFGTNKAAMVWGTLWATRTYARRVRLPWTMLVPAIVALARVAVHPLGVSRGDGRTDPEVGVRCLGAIATAAACLQAAPAVVDSRRNPVRNPVRLPDPLDCRRPIPWGC